MSEHINEIMEKMVPSLQDMEDNQIFSHVSDLARELVFIGRNCFYHT